jgi:hypothetical protein
MAINLWKIGGKPLSYNPLPTGYTNGVVLEIGDYILSFNAKSNSNGNLMIDRANQSGDTFITLTPDLKKYTVSFNIPVKQSVFLYSSSGATDIIIDSIELVQKPLPKLTLNGVDGFMSGKWFNPYGIIVDDDTLTINADASYRSAFLLVNVLPNTIYSVTCETSNGKVGIYNADATSVINGYGTPVPKSFNTGNNTQIRIYLSNDSQGAGQYTFKRPMLNLGSTPAPYSRKTGDKMVMPNFKKNLLDMTSKPNIPVSGWAQNLIQTPNQVSFTTDTAYGGPQPKLEHLLPYLRGKTITLSCGKLINCVVQLVVKKGGTSYSNQSINSNGYYTYTIPNDADSFYLNYLSNSVGYCEVNNVQIEEGTSATAFTPYDVQVNKKAKKYVPKKNLFNKSTVTKGYSLTGIGTSNVNVTFSYSDYITVKPNTTYYKTATNGGEFYDLNKVVISAIPSGVNSNTFTTPSNCYFMRMNVPLDLLDSYQLEEGSTATSYEPYTQVLPQARTGLAFNGVSDYLQLPSMTMDSVEIDCLIDSVQSSGNHKLFDARPGSVNGYVQINGGTFFYGSDIKNLNGAVIGQRTKIKTDFFAPFTDDITIFKFNGASLVDFTKAILYKVTCYLGGQVVAQYDFENPSNIVGNTVLQNANNLIPSFEDARWNLHANTQVLGKNVLRLNATATQQQRSIINIPVNPSTTYKFVHNANGRVRIARGDTDALLGDSWSTSTWLINVPSGVTSVNVGLDNNATLGTFDFVKPQLYALSGTEGTLNGTPRQGNKPSKRIPYAKR